MHNTFNTQTALYIIFEPWLEAMTNYIHKSGELIARKSSQSLNEVEGQTAVQRG